MKKTHQRNTNYITKRYHHIPNRKGKIKKHHNNCSWGFESAGAILHLCQECTMRQTC